MTGIELEPTPPPPRPTCSARSSQTVLAERAGAGDVALLLDSDLVVEGEDCSISFLLVPDARRRRAAAGDGWACSRWRRRWSGWASSPPRPSPATCSSPSAWAPASAWRCSTGGSASPGWRTSCCPRARGNAPAGAYKFADIAVPELIDRVVALGGRARDARGRAGRRREHVRASRARRSRSARATRPPCATCSPRSAHQRDRGRDRRRPRAARSASTSARARSRSVRPAASRSTAR